MSPIDRILEGRAAAREARAAKSSIDTVDAVVLCAMGEELAPFLEDATDPVELDAPGDARALRATVRGLDLVLVRTRVGLVNAATATTWALLGYAPRVVVSAGAAGGLHPDVEVGDVVVATELVYGQADATAFGYARGQVPGQPPTFSVLPALVEAGLAAGRSMGQPVREGLVLSGDAFVTAANVDSYRSAFPEALSTDMESTAIAQVATDAGVPVISVRGISDLCGPAADQDFHLEVDHVAGLSARVVLGMLAD
ncbi:5'-methylthioadenosine/S-adenosylhomocysteine nucleosidase [Georgenia sp. Z1491]|uniref:5'-methylthioadenosine/S-adenosylhomocysteine nucleosidase n=1 Tax=Georgenia sp. Z1491 TaxID=3416707 RepID=UPI003CF00E59